jgi:hypothetical protein
MRLGAEDECTQLLRSADQVFSISLTTLSGIGMWSSSSAVLEPFANAHLKNLMASAEAALSDGSLRIRMKVDAVTGHDLSPGCGCQPCNRLRSN